jgi:hypothetical protein
MKVKQTVGTIGLAVAVATACTNPTSIVIEPLRVINWSPASGSFCIETDVTIYATFSDNVEADSLTADSLYLLDSDGNVEATLAYDEQNYTARLTPSDPLDFGRVYTVVATTEIRSTEKGRLPVELETSFQTVPRTGCTPGVECSLPSDCENECPGSDACICANIGVCIPECVTDADCFRGSCSNGACIPDVQDDGGGDTSGDFDGNGD